MQPLFQQTPDGGYIVGGNSTSDISGDKTENNIGSFINPDYWVLKLNSSGNIQWQNTIGGSSGERLESICMTDDGGYLIGGRSGSDISGDKSENSIGNFDFWIVKLNSSGVIQWENTIGGDGDDRCHAVVQATDGGIPGRWMVKFKYIWR